MTEEQIFLSAVELADSVDRIAYLEKACSGDAELRRRVEGLLAAHFKPGEFLDEAVGKQLGAGPAHPFKARVATQQANYAGEVLPDDKKTTGERDDFHFLLPPTRSDSLGRIGHYAVLQVLGTGGFGIVFRAIDEVLQRAVALKVLAPAIAATSPARKRFLREARSSAQVRHENVVQVYAVEEQPTPYLVMEFIPGQTLQQLLDATGPLEAPEIVRLGRQIAEGLAAAHATALIHRDIKPGNVLLENGPQWRAKITDFGLARAADDASMTQSGMLAGTPMYMAPEQAKGETLDHRADLFSLGSVLYVMATGRPPFRASTTYAVLKRVVEDTPRPIRELIPEIPQWLADVIAKLHAKKADDRFQSARELADVLADCEAQLKAKARVTDFSRIPRIKATPGWFGKGKWIAAALLAPVLALAIAESARVTHWLPAHRSTSALLKYGDTDFTNSLGMKFKLIPAGRFTMGSPHKEIDRCLELFGDQDWIKTRLPAEGPEHEVEIAQAYYLGITEVTFGQFRRFMEANPKYDQVDDHWKLPPFYQSDNHPVVWVSRQNAIDFCDWMSAQDEKKYRLPTEAEWEYACRAGKSGTRYSWGDDDAQLTNFAWYAKNATGIMPVGQKKPNEWGLYDMHGNVWEYCQDDYDPTYYNTSPGKDPPGGTGAPVVMRGGAWDSPSALCRSAFRHHSQENPHNVGLAGFRVLLVAPPSEDQRQQRQ